MTMSLKALTTAFLKWQEEQLQPVALGKHSTWEIYRPKLKVLRGPALRYLSIPWSLYARQCPRPRHRKGTQHHPRKQVYAKYTTQMITQNPW